MLCCHRCNLVDNILCEISFSECRGHLSQVYKNWYYIIFNTTIRRERENWVKRQENNSECSKKKKHINIVWSSIMHTLCLEIFFVLCMKHENSEGLFWPNQPFFKNKYLMRKNLMRIKGNKQNNLILSEIKHRSTKNVLIHFILKLSYDGTCAFTHLQSI